MLHLFFPFLPSVPTNVCLCILASTFLYIYINIFCYSDLGEIVPILKNN